MKTLQSIWLVDDDADDRDFFELAVGELDKPLQVDFATNGGELLDRLKRHRPDLLFLDINMHPINGFECLIRIRQEPGLSDLPIVMYSSTGNPDEVNRTRELGAHLFIHKPESFQQLKFCIKKALDLDWDEPRLIAQHYFLANRAFC